MGSDVASDPLLTDSRIHLGFRLRFFALGFRCLAVVDSYRPIPLLVSGFGRDESAARLIFCKSEFHFKFDSLSVQLLHNSLFRLGVSFVLKMNWVDFVYSNWICISKRKIILVVIKNTCAV